MLQEPTESYESLPTGHPPASQAQTHSACVGEADLNDMAEWLVEEAFRTR